MLNYIDQTINEDIRNKEKMGGGETVGKDAFQGRQGKLRTG